MHACVHESQLHLKLVQAESRSVAPPAAAVTAAAPQRKRRASGEENAAANINAAATTAKVTPAFQFGVAAPEAAAGAPGAAPVRAGRARKPAPRGKRVARNKRISETPTTSSEVSLFCN
jgi:hypothetical protein